MKFSLRDLFWVIVVVAIGLGWFADHWLAHSRYTQVAKALARASKRPRGQSPSVYVPVDTHSADLNEAAAIVSEYVRHWEKTAAWPPPDTYSTNIWTYKSSEETSTQFPNRRRDFYYTPDREGREVDVILWDDGRIEIKSFRDD